MSVLRPFQSDKTATRLTVPSAYRAWAYWATTVGYGCLQVASVRAMDLDKPTELLALCEVYSRAIFETQLGLHFDASDSHVDQAVLILIRDLYSDDVAVGVHRSVAAHGPVVRDYDGAIMTALVEAAQEARAASEAEVAARACLAIEADAAREVRTTPPPALPDRQAYCVCGTRLRLDDKGACVYCGAGD